MDSENVQIKANHSARLFCLDAFHSPEASSQSVGGTEAGMNKMELQGEVEFPPSVPYSDGELQSSGDRGAHLKGDYLPSRYF